MRLLLSLLLFVHSLAFADLNESLKSHIKFDREAENRVGYLYIGDHSDQISQATWIYVKNALEKYQEIKPIFVILELDTPGGQVYPAQKISDALKELDTQLGIPVVAVINNWAMSAGAMLAYSCRYIATVKDGAMGAATPVTSTGEATSEKVNSAMRADFANRAAFFGRNPLLAKAMVDPDLVLVLRNGNILELGSNDEIKSSDHVITRKGKLLTLDSEEMMELHVADLLLPPTRVSAITKLEKEKGEWEGKKMSLFSAPFFKEIPNVKVIAYNMDWKTKFFAILASPIVTSLLFLGLMVCFYIEISTPGFGVAGTLGIICLFLILLSSFAVQAAPWFEVILLITGIALLLIELFFIPGFGVTGVVGIILAVGALIALLLPGIRDFHFDLDTNTFNAAGLYILERLVFLSVTIVVAFLLIAFLSRYLTPKLQLFSPLVLRGEQEKKEGFFAGLTEKELPQAGSEGVALSYLRLAGKVVIDEKIYDAVSSGAYIEKGAKIKVIDVSEGKVVVEEV